MGMNDSEAGRSDDKLNHVIAEYLEHYNRERNHQGIWNELIEGEATSSVGDIERRERLGGLLKYYRRAA